MSSAVSSDGEVVERVAVERHLDRPVLALRRPEEGSVDALAGSGITLHRERRPAGLAVVVARALGALIDEEHVERAPLGGVHDDLPEVRVLHGDRRLGGLFGRLG